MSESRSESYKAAGVDVTAGYEAVKLMKPMVESTFTKGVMGTLGGFGGLFRPDFKGMADPILVSGTDGVGTKLKLAFLMDKHDTVGIDCVAMCVNDIACCGAQPLFFLDYIAVGKNHPAKIAQMVSGIAEGCRQAGCALIGGETAEMPGFYPEDEYDMAGFSVGMVDKEKMIDGTTIRQGDALVGVASSGVHSNGYSLVRKTLGINEKSVRRYIDEFGQNPGRGAAHPDQNLRQGDPIPDGQGGCQGHQSYHRRRLLRKRAAYAARRHLREDRKKRHAGAAGVRPDCQNGRHTGARYVQHVQYGRGVGAFGCRGGRVARGRRDLGRGRKGVYHRRVRERREGRGTRLTPARLRRV